MTVYLFGRILHGEGSIGAPGEEEIKKPGTTGIADALQELLRRTEGATPPGIYAYRAKEDDQAAPDLGTIAPYTRGGFSVNPES